MREHLGYALSLFIQHDGTPRGGFSEADDKNGLIHQALHLLAAAEIFWNRWVFELAGVRELGRA